MTTTASSRIDENTYVAPEARLHPVAEQVPARLLVSYITGPVGIAFGLVSLMVHVAGRGTLVGFGLVYSLMFLLGLASGATGLALALGYKRTSWDIVGRRAIRLAVAISVIALMVALLAGIFVMQALYNK